jgi:hypothetical protein
VAGMLVIAVGGRRHKCSLGERTRRQSFECIKWIGYQHFIAIYVKIYTIK